jgi:hypothetical protein
MAAGRYSEAAMRFVPFLIVPFLIPVGGLFVFVLGLQLICDAITTAVRRWRLRRQVKESPPPLPRPSPLVRAASEDLIGS